MKVKIFFSIILVFVAFVCASGQTQKKNILPNSFCNELKFKWLDKVYEGRLCVIKTEAQDRETPKDLWVYFDFHGKNKLLNDRIKTQSDLPENTEDLITSPDAKFGAVLCINEEMKFVQIIDLQSLILFDQYIVLHEFQLFSAWCKFEKWEGLNFYFSSNIRLDERFQMGISPETLTETLQYVFHIETCEIELISN